MNTLYFTSNLKLINLTPFKYSLCVLINSFLKDIEIQKKSNNLIYFDIFIKLLNEFNCEISKKYFFNKINEKIEESFQDSINDPDNLTKSEIRTHIMSLLENNFSKVQSLNDLYIIFNYEIRELQLKSELNNSLIEKGGIIDNFIRKVLLAFYKLSFEDLFKLYSDLRSYIKGDDLTIHLSNRESEVLFEKQMTDLSKISRDSFDEKILDSINYKHKYFHLAKLNIHNENFLFDIHKFFDYNMKYFYDDTSQSETKIHYSLMNLIEYYYNNGYYEYAIQVLIESIKLNQRSCDHEGLLKCFLWMQKIYRNAGNFEMAKKFLSTCLIKSFENNFTLLYLISTSELAILNYNFYSRIGDANLKNSKWANISSAQSMEEKILSFSNSYNYSYKNMMQFLSCSKSDFVYDKTSNHYMKYVYVSIILNLLRRGKNSLSITYLKFFIEFVFRDKEDKKKNSSLKNLNFEMIEIILNLLFEVYEYDINYVIEKFEAIINCLPNRDDTEKTNYMIHLLKTKFISFTLINLSNICDSSKIDKSFGQIKNNVYHTTYIKYQELENSFYRVKYLRNQNPDMNFLEKELIDFKSYCKITNFYKFKILSNILLAKIFLMKGKTTEALFIITKAIKKLEITEEDYLTLKLKLTLLEIYTKMGNFGKSRELVSDIELSIDSIGNVIDNYDFYFINTQFSLINPNTSNNSNGFLLKCIKYAVLSNNSGMIKNSIILLDLASTIPKCRENSTPILIKNNFLSLKELLHTHSEQLNKLLSMYENFSLLPKQSLELIKVIHLNNQNTIRKIYQILN